MLWFLALVIPTQARAEHATEPHPDTAAACEHNPTCLAVAFADALTISPLAPHELKLDALVTFPLATGRVYSAGRERIAALAQAWNDHPTWRVITVDGYPDAWARSEAAGAALAQLRAERVRGYLIRYGLDPDSVVAVGHASSAADPSVNSIARSRVDLTIAVCDRTTEECRGRPIPQPPAPATK
jgi:outer membrane protein OmpA-like peptidoglycan-associated protein